MSSELSSPQSTIDSQSHASQSQFDRSQSTIDLQSHVSQAAWLQFVIASESARSQSVGVFVGVLQESVGVLQESVEFPAQSVRASQEVAESPAEFARALQEIAPAVITVNKIKTDARIFAIGFSLIIFFPPIVPLIFIRSRSFNSRRPGTKKPSVQLYI